jgi:hypothetical protein
VTRAIDIEKEEECVRLRLVAPEGGEPGCYLGGRPPAPAAGADTGPAVQYLATVPFPPEPDRCCSVFIAPFEALISEARAWRTVGLVTPILHPPAPRTAHWDRLCEPTSEHGLAIAEVVPDEHAGEAGGRFRWSGLKLGGRPAFKRSAAAADEYTRLRQEGFAQLLQADWYWLDPAAQPVEGTWPFGDGLFSLLVRRHGGSYDWRWLWQP